MKLTIPIAYEFEFELQGIFDHDKEKLSEEKYILCAFVRQCPPIPNCTCCPFHYEKNKKEYTFDEAIKIINEKFNQRK